MSERKAEDRLDSNADYAKLFTDCVNHFRPKLGAGPGNYDLLP
jgi:hypothetical protein